MHVKLCFHDRVLADLLIAILVFEIGQKQLPQLLIINPKTSILGVVTGNICNYNDITFKILILIV